MQSELFRSQILFKKYFNQTLSAEEEKELQDWLTEQKNELLFNHLFRNDKVLLDVEKLDFLSEKDVHEDWNKIWDRISQPEAIKTTSTLSIISIWWKLMIAAILIIALTIVATYHFTSTKADADEQLIGLKQDIELPGSSRAILTLSTGKRIVLDSTAKILQLSDDNLLTNDNKSGVLTYTNEIAVNSKESEYHTLEIPVRGQYKLRLSDGTVIWLNAASSVRYPPVFKGSTRDIFITGEVYIEAAKKAQPLIVHLPDQSTITVLGTKFAINTYANEPVVKTTLLEGSILQKVVIKGQTHETLLRPGEHSIYNPETPLKIAHVQDEEATAFIHGYFFFNNVDERAIFRQIERWYGVKVVYSKATGTKKYYGKIQRSFTLTDMIEALATYGIHVTRKGEILYL